MNERKLSSTLIKDLSTFKVDESARESIRMHESFRPNESESLNFHQLSYLFGPGLRIFPLEFNFGTLIFRGGFVVSCLDFLAIL